MSTTAGTISGAIKWTGLASGTDFASVVEQLVAIEERTITRQQTWQAQWQEKLTAINNLDTRLVSLKLNAQDYDTRDKLLSRSTSISDESVATLSNLSTAALGTYSVEVGSSIQEKIASRTYKNDAAIGGGARKDASGNYLDSENRVIGTADPDNASVLQAIADKLGLGAVEYDSATKYYYEVGNNSPGQEVARLDDSSAPQLAVYAYSSGADGDLIAAVKEDNKNSGRDEFVLATNGYTIPIGDDSQAYYAPLTISMGGKELSLTYDPNADPGDIGVYSDTFTMEDLVGTINNTLASDPDNMPDISLEVMFDKNRDGESYSRLVITGGVGGQANHVVVSDPTDLGLDQNNFDQPVCTSLVGTSIRPVITADSSYTGHSNKSITFVPTNGGTLGTDNISFSWADTEGNSGTFVLKASDWDAQNNCMREDIEIIQGLKLNFDFGSSGLVIKSEAFTIDCQTPVMQKADDNGLAVSDKWVHKGFADLTSPVTYGASGNFDYSYAGKEYSVTISDGLGLQGLVDKINSDSSNPGVVASILNDGMGTATSYKLVLTGNEPGVEHSIRILPTTSLNRMDCAPEDFEQAREASNSMCRIDGYPNDGTSWIQRSTNDVGDVIDGVVVSLKSVGTATVNVTNDVSSMVDKIKQLVESVNFCKSYIKEQTKYGGGKVTSKWNESTQQFERTTEGGSASGVMIGNYGFQISLSEIDGMMTKAIFTREEYIKAIDPEGIKQGALPKDEQQALYEQYLEDNGLAYTRLSDIGIASNHEMDGTYVVEEAVLREALNKNPEAVIKLFTFTPEDSMGTIQKYADESARPAIAGFAVNMSYKMSDLTRSEDVIDSQTGEVTQPAKGITKVLAANYTNIISGIDDKIAREEKRISMVRSRLEEKFSRLETLLAELNNQSSSIEAQLSKLDSD